MAGSLAAQTLTAREIFYGQGRPEAAKRRAPKTAAAKAPSAPDNVPAPRQEPPATEEQSAPRQGNDSVQYVNLNTTPLGLKYTILKRSPDGEYAQVSGDATFLSGDQIKLVIESNSPGYLYVVTQGASQKWKPVSFSQDGNSKSNRVERGGRYTIPPGDKVLSFVSPSGAEKLFVVLSRQPETDLEKLIYSLDGQPNQNETSPTMLAKNLGPVEDDLVQRLRKTYNRDLIIEQVDDSQKPGVDTAKRTDGTEGPPEKAVYAVNTKAGDNARVVADIELRHE